MKGMSTLRIFCSLISPSHLLLHDLAPSKVPLTSDCFCVIRGLIHHESFWKHHAKPATVTVEKDQTTAP